jgi:hypothetical protein
MQKATAKIVTASVCVASKLKSEPTFRIWRELSSLQCATPGISRIIHMIDEKFQ